MRSCLLEEMTQVLGLPADSDLIRPSIFSSRDWAEELSINDKILVRALYDDRIEPGMTRAEAQPVIREVISDLVARVSAEGENALTHPRYKPTP